MKTINVALFIISVSLILGTPVISGRNAFGTAPTELPEFPILMTWKGWAGDQRIFYSIYDYASNSWTPVTPIEGANTSTDPSTIVATTITPTTPPTTTPPTTTPPTTCSEPPSGLVSWWPGDGNADDILGNNDGVLQSGASFGSGIAGGQAFRLDGIDDFVEMPSMDIGNTFSIDFWVYPEGFINYVHLISNHYTSTDNFGALYLRYGNLEYWQNGAAWFQQTPGSQTLQPNTWYHITLTYDGSVIRIYANGNELSSVTDNTQHSETFNNALRISSSIPHESGYLQGLIDDVGIYDRALSLSEIQALSQGAKCNPTAETTSEEEE